MIRLKNGHDTTLLPRLVLFGLHEEYIPVNLRRMIKRSLFVEHQNLPRVAISDAMGDADLCVAHYSPEVPCLNYSFPLKLFERIGIIGLILYNRSQTFLKIWKDFFRFRDFNLDDRAHQHRVLIQHPGKGETIPETVVRTRDQFAWNSKAERLDTAPQPML